jgi:uncharacterized membrane protein YkoI
MNVLIKRILALALVLATVPALAKDKESQADLQKEAKVTKEAAEKTALAKVPNGTVKESELEREHGKLVWSFDIATPGSKDITEVQVDAKTGAVVSTHKESAKTEAVEKKKEHTSDPGEHKH